MSHAAHKSDWTDLKFTQSYFPPPLSPSWGSLPDGYVEKKNPNWLKKCCNEISCARLLHDFHNTVCAPTAESDSKNAAEKLCWEADKSCLANFHRKLRCCARQSDAWWDTVGQRLAGDQSNKGRDWLDLKDLGKRSRQDTTWVVFIYSPMQPFVCESCDARDTILFRQLKFSHPQGDAALFAQGRSFWREEFSQIRKGPSSNVWGAALLFHRITI